MASWWTSKHADTADCDVELYLHDISKLNRAYQQVLTKLQERKGAKQDDREVQDMLLERQSLKQQFIGKKQAVRALFDLQRTNSTARSDPAALDAWTTRLKSLQDEFRSLDLEFKELGYRLERDALNLSAESKESAGADGGITHVGRTNDDLISSAQAKEEKNSADLIAAHVTLMQARTVAVETVAELQGQHETMERISKGLDEVQSELRIARLLIIAFMKRMATDKVLLAFATLLILGVVGIIIYASVNPKQSAFRVPDLVKPPTQS